MLLALLGAVSAHKIEEDDVIENVDIRKVDVRRQFGDFVKSFKGSKGHLRSNDAVKQRYQIFAHNAHKIKNHNKKGSRFRMEVNAFSDMSMRERQLYTGLANTTHTAYHKRSLSARHALQLRESAPETFDHRDEGHVTPVTDQGDCGSCWTYGVVYPLEAEVSILSGKRAVALSNQEILSCAYEDEEDRNGCNGGWYMDGWNYAKESGHLSYAADEPYLGIDMHCDPDVLDLPNGLHGYKVTDWERVPEGDDAALKLFSSQHVVAVAIESLGLFFYSNGLFEDPYCETPAAVDHAVTLVGYDTEAWIIKNSWGPSWGENGYVRMSRSPDLPSHCGVADYAYFPVVEEE